MYSLNASQPLMIQTVKRIWSLIQEVIIYLISIAMQRSLSSVDSWARLQRSHEISFAISLETDVILLCKDSRPSLASKAAITIDNLDSVGASKNQTSVNWPATEKSFASTPASVWVAANNTTQFD